MTIIPRDAHDPAPADRAHPRGLELVTQPGHGQRVGAPTTDTGTSPRGTVAVMDDALLPEIATRHAPRDPSELPWAHERVLALVADGRLYTDNRRRTWITSASGPAALLADRRMRTALHELCNSGMVYGSHADAKTTIDVTECRSLRVRKYMLTDSGTDLYTRWARLAPYTA